MKRIGKIFITAGAVIFAAVFTAILYVYLKFPPQAFHGKKPVPESQLPPDTVMTEEQVISDRNEMIQYVENIHPYFLLIADKSAYLVAKGNYVAATSCNMTVSQFCEKTSMYLCFFRDAHTRIYWNENQMIDAELDYRNNKLYFVGKPFFVTKIGGIPVSSVLSVVDRILPAENDMAKVCNYTEYSKYGHIIKAAGGFADNGDVQITFSDDSVEKYRMIPPRLSSTVPTTNSWYMDNDIFVVDFNTCNDNDELSAIVTELEQALARGTKKVIIDARGNEGGNSDACIKLLKALGMVPPEYGMFVRFSREAATQNGYTCDSGSFKKERDKTVIQNPSIQLVVLTDRHTFSSATMLAVYVRDGGLGTIIGEPSPNSPSCYGDVIFFHLDNSHLFGTISHKMFDRPDDRKMDENMLIPDITTNSGEALSVAEKFLSAKM